MVGVGRKLKDENPYIIGLAAQRAGLDSETIEILAYLCKFFGVTPVDLANNMSESLKEIKRLRSLERNLQSIKEKL